MSLNKTRMNEYLFLKNVNRNMYKYFTQMYGFWLCIQYIYTYIDYMNDYYQKNSDAFERLIELECS